MAYRKNLIQYMTMLLIAASFFYIFYDNYIDDAYITLSYADTLAKYGVWGMHPDLVSNSATSPLNVILLSLFIFFIRDGLISLYLFNITVAAGIFYYLSRFSYIYFSNNTWAIIATIFLYLNPLLISTLGLESYLFILIALAICYYLSTNQNIIVWLLVGLLYLTRPDGALIGLSVVIYNLANKSYKNLQWLPLAMIIPAIWTVISWKYLGSAIPDTLFIKKQQASWGLYGFYNGPILYLEKYWTQTILSIIFIPFIFITKNKAIIENPIYIIFGSFAIIHYLSYSLLNVPPYHWYYSYLTTFIVLAGSFSLYQLAGESTGLTIFTSSIAAISIACSLLSTARFHTPPITSNWAGTHEYKEIAKWINENIESDTILLWGELGVLQYHTNANLIDFFSDRQFALKYLNAPNNSIKAKILKVNFKNLTIPNYKFKYLVEISDCNTSDVLKRWETGTTWGPGMWCVRKFTN